MPALFLKSNGSAIVGSIILQWRGCSGAAAQHILSSLPTCLRERGRQKAQTLEMAHHHTVTPLTNLQGNTQRN